MPEPDTRPDVRPDVRPDTGPDAGLARAFVAACNAELQALKPGNVHIHAAGHTMTVADFETSARVSAPFIAARGWPAGRRIRAAVDATFDAVGCNTNLGILLLCAPLAMAAESGNVLAALPSVLHSLSVADAVDVFAAIRRASPAGLGNAPAADVAAEPEITLLEAMQHAQSRDRIALQYVSDYADITGFALPALEEGIRRHGDGPLSVTHLYLCLLRAFPDTHLARKHGPDAAARVQREVQQLFPDFAGMADFPALLAFDARLKAARLNPGTAADLTVATVFCHNI